MKIADITDIRVHVSGQRLIVSFNDAAARYHIRLDAEGAYDWKRLDKNPPLGASTSYPTRKLNPLTVVNAKALRHVLSVVRRDDLIGKARAAEAEREAAADAEARASALAERRVVIGAWVQALSEADAVAPWPAFTDDEVNAIAARVRELGGGHL